MQTAWFVQQNKKAKLLRHDAETQTFEHNLKVKLQILNTISRTRTKHKNKKIYDKYIKLLEF